MNVLARVRMLAVLILITILIGSLSCLSLAAPVGVAESVQGRVMLQRGATTTLLQSGQALQEGDRLSSAGESEAVLALGTHRLRLGPDASLLIVRANEIGQHYTIFLWLGRIWLFVLKQAKAVDFRVETPSALAGVRGTLFSVRVETDGGTWVGVAEGIVSVSTPAGTGEVTLAAGYGTKVAPGGKPERPKKLKRGEVGGSDLKEKHNNGRGHGQAKKDRGR